MPTPSDPTVGLPDLQGRWRKLSTEAEAEQYPTEITFAKSTYRGSRAEDQGMIWWDAGIYRLVDERTLTLSTATDEMVTYPVRIDADRLTVTVAGECDVVFERAESPPP